MKGGVATELFNVVDVPFAVNQGDTVNMKVQAVGDSISVFLNNTPVPGLNPLIDADPILAGDFRVGVGQETNPTYFDNLSMQVIPEPGSVTLLVLGMLGLLGYGRWYDRCRATT